MSFTTGRRGIGLSCVGKICSSRDFNVLKGMQLTTPHRFQNVQNNNSKISSSIVAHFMPHFLEGQKEEIYHAPFFCSKRRLLMLTPHVGE